MLARTQTALYRGDGTAAWRRLEEQKWKLRSSMLLRVQAFRIELLYLRARSALAVAATGRSANRFLTVARRSARRIAREEMRWSNPIALLLQAGIASVERQPALAEARLRGAVELFDCADMKLYAAVARRRLGELQGDDRGRELQRLSEAWMASQQIRNPAAITRMLAPGFPEPDPL